jgi:hypothetical protein
MYIPASDIGSAIVTDGGASGVALYSSCKSFNGLHSTFRILEGPNTQKLTIAGVDQGKSANLILKSNDGGASWNPFDLTNSNLPASKDGIAKSVMSIDNENDFLVVLGETGTPAQRVYRTTNGGASFQTVTGLPDNSPTGHRYGPQNAFIERDATLPGVRYFVARGQDLYKSTDRGASWAPTTHPFGLSAWVWGFHADPVRSNNLWAAGDYAGVKFSRDGGQSWSGTAQYFDARYVSSCDGKIAVWGKANGGDNPALLWYSADDGVTWKAQTTAERNFHGVQGITVDRNGRIWVSWNSVTVVTPAGLVTSTESDQASFENSISLYPNPTQGSLSLKIQNEAQGLHTISVYDVAGKKLTTIQASKNGETMEVPLSLSDYPNGVYYIETTNVHSRSFKKVAKY